MNEEFELTSEVLQSIWYYTTCEAYDRTVCTGPIRKDGILPNNIRELGQIGRHASLARRVMTTSLDTSLYKEYLYDDIRSTQEYKQMALELNTNLNLLLRSYGVRKNG